LSLALKTELGFGFTKLRIAFLNEEIVGRFLMPLPRLFHSLIQNGKKEARKRSVLQKGIAKGGLTQNPSLPIPSSSLRGGRISKR